MHRFTKSALRSLTVPVAFLLFISAAGAGELVDFERQVQPILADKCFACHGRDADHREGGLRLDERAAALKGGEGGEPAIVPGKPEKSELVRRIDSSDESELMPPPDSKKELTAQERAILRRWVAEGAQYQAHWALVAPRRPPLPKVNQTDWPRNDLDRFVLARLEQEGLQPSPEADRVTLVRRLTLDLTGLPPTVAEVDAFVTDRSPDAYEKLVERLLHSPHYGERWGRLWLDGAAMPIPTATKRTSHDSSGLTVIGSSAP